jgi:nitrate reductase alpha subunit
VEDRFEDVAFPYFGNIEHDHFAGTDHASVVERRVPVRRLPTAQGEVLVATVYDLFLANYGIDRGFGGANVAKSFDENEPYTPAWAERITGVPRDQIITVAREFARNAEKTTVGR